ncbi:MAG: LssY C-terminal domain-containing protein [Deltaproteobacteria bacterium]
MTAVRGDTQVLRLFFIFLIGCLPLMKVGCASYCATQSEVENAMFSTPPAKGCRVYSPSPDPLREVPFLMRSETQTEDGITVTAAVLSDPESREVFGVNLAKKGIQPVWIRIENDTGAPVTLVHVGIDPAYFSPNEAANRNYIFASPVNDEINEYFNEHGIGRMIPAGGELSGFFYTNWDPGVKYLNVSVFGEDREENFLFYLEIPGITIDFQRVDWDSIYGEEEFVDYQNEDDLRRALESVPCCSTRKDGTGKNDPLNFFVIGESDQILSAFIRRGWDVTEPITAGSGWRAFKAFFSGARYRTSPMSSIYVYKRAQDVGFQKARSTIHERNHLRLWLMPVRYKGMDVWIGSVSRDIGSYLTIRTPWLTAHAIDPDIDEARVYVEQDLLFSGAVRKFGYVKGIKPATPENPHRNFMKQPYWTDGYRAVFIIQEDPTHLSELEFFDWEWAGENSREMIEYIKNRNNKKTEN